MTSKFPVLSILGVIAVLFNSNVNLAVFPSALILILSSSVGT